MVHTHPGCHFSQTLTAGGEEAAEEGAFLACILPAGCASDPSQSAHRCAAVLKRRSRAAGIAPTSQIPQVVSPHATCVEHGCQWLHYVCTEEALQELFATWHHLTPSVRHAIMELARGG